MKSAIHLCMIAGLFAVAALAGAVERTHQIQPEDYFTQVFLSGVAAAPDGNRSVYVDLRWDKENDGRTRDLWLLDHKTKQTERLTFDPGNEVSPTWSPDGEWIYFIGHLEQGGADSPPWDGSAQVWRIRPSGEGLMAVTRVNDGIYDYRLSADGGALYYTRTRDHVTDPWAEMREQYRNDLQFGHGVEEVSTLHRLDLASWRSEQILDPMLHIHEFAVSPDESRIALITTADGKLVSLEGWSDVQVVDAASGEMATLPDKLFREDEESPHGWLGELSWSGDGDKLAFSVAFDGYPTEILVADLAGGAEDAEMKKLQRPDVVFVAGGLQWMPGDEELAFLGDIRARQRVYAIDVDSEKSRELTPGDVVIDGFDFAGDRGDLVAIQSELTYYHDLVYHDRKGRSTRLTHLNPQVDSWKLPKTQIYQWEGANGDTVEGILELPPDYKEGDGPLPLLVAIHGGPTSSDKLSFLLWIYGRAAFAAKGWAMLAPNYRGSTGYGDEFLTDLIGHENDWDVKDIMTGVDALIADGIVDEDRMAVSGWSNGGFLTNCLIPTNRFKAASSGAGVADMTIQLLEEDTPGHVINYMEGLPWEVPAEYQDASPVYDLKPEITTAVLLHHGENDPRVPLTHGEGMHRMLTRYIDAPPCELVIYPGAGHNLTKYSQRLAKVRWDHAWFDKYVTGEGE